MAGPIYVDRVQETTTTSGTGTYTLAGAVTGFQSFAAVGNANTCYYAATDGIDWEVGLGTYTSSGTTLARTAVLASSNANAAVSWSGSAKNIWVDAAAVFFTGLVTAAAAFSPTANDGKALGTTALGWSDLFGATGFTINFANGDWVATHSTGIVTVSTGDLRVTTAGTNTASVVTVGGAQTLTSKTLTSPIVNTDITIPNTGLHILDTNASHDLIVAPGSNLTADRTLTITTGDTNLELDLTDPGADRLLFWDDSASKWRDLTLGTNLSITTTTLDASGGEPIATASPYAVGVRAILQNKTGGQVNDNATASGSSLETYKVSSTGTAQSSGVQTGTWKNVAGSNILNTASGYFVRTL